MESAAFRRFRLSFFEDTNSARDGLDKPALAQLEGEERTRAEDMLIDYLPDARGVIGLGVLRSQRAEPRLAQLFEAERRAQLEAARSQDKNWWPDMLVYLAKTLWQIGPDRRWLAAMTDVLASGNDWTQRTIAAEALYDVYDPAAVEALTKALDDPDELVRHHAARGLLALHDLPAESKDPDHMLYRVMSKDTARRDGGKRDILAAIAGRPPKPE